MPSIKGHTILAIGGSSGIGAAVAKLAAAEGSRVSIASSNRDRVDGAISKIRAAVPDDAQLTGRVHGEHRQHPPLADADLAYLRSTIHFPFIVPYMIAKLARKYVKRSPTSSINFTSGRIGEKPYKGFEVMAAVGASLFGAARGLALEMAPVRVNTVAPGVVDTELLATEEMRKNIIERISPQMLLGRIATAGEVGEAYIYLMKNTNSTGHVISTNGGAMLQ